MITFQFEPFPELTTERMRLRKIELSDAAEVFALRSDPTLMQYIARPVAHSLQEAEELILTMETGRMKNESIGWGITLKGSDKIIGIAGFPRTTPEHHRGEIGYTLSGDLHGKGLIPEAVMSILNFGFNTMNLHLIEAYTDPRNIPSIKVLKKLGFRMDGHMLENCFFEDKYYDTMHFSLLKRDFNS